MALPAPRRPVESDHDRQRWIDACAELYDRAREAGRAQMACASVMIRLNQGGAILLRIPGGNRAVPEAAFIAEGFGGFGDLGYQTNG